jgi:hypothetical protein
VILSHHRRFIFLKTRKTAGTSLEIALSAYCGPDDVITPVLPEDEALRAALGYRGPQGYKGEPVVPEPQRRRHGMRFYNHMPAREARLAIDPAHWRDYLKISIERNPWDKAMSMYYWRSRHGPRPPLRRFLRRLERNAARRGHDPLLTNWPVYAIEAEVVADVVLPFEGLDAGVAELAERLELPGPLELPRAKTLSVPDRVPYREAMGPEERSIVERVCHHEIERFGYEF